MDGLATAGAENGLAQPRASKVEQGGSKTSLEHVQGHESNERHPDGANGDSEHAHCAESPVESGAVAAGCPSGQNDRQGLDCLDAGSAEDSQGE